MSDPGRQIRHVLQERADQSPHTVAPAWAVLQQRHGRRQQARRRAGAAVAAVAGLAGALVVLPGLHATDPAATAVVAASPPSAPTATPVPRATTPLSDTSELVFLVQGPAPSGCLGDVRIVDVPGSEQGSTHALEVPPDQATDLIACLPEGAFLGTAVPGLPRSSNGTCGDLPARPTAPELQDMVGLSLGAARTEAVRQDRPLRVAGAQGICLVARLDLQTRRINVGLSDGVVTHAHPG